MLIVTVKFSLTIHYFRSIVIKYVSQSLMVNVIFVLLR